MSDPAAKPLGLPEETVRKFIGTFAKHLDEHAQDAIERVCRDKALEYLRFATSLFPKEMSNGDAMLKEISDDKLAAMLRYLGSVVGEARETPSEEIQDT